MKRTILFTSLSITLAVYKPDGIDAKMLAGFDAVVLNNISFAVRNGKYGVSATAQRQQVGTTLVQMVGNLGFTTLAEGMETATAHTTCRQMGFDLDQAIFTAGPPLRGKSSRNT